MDLVATFIKSALGILWQYFSYFIGGMTQQKIILLDFMVGDLILFLMINLKFSKGCLCEIRKYYFQKKIACWILIGVAQSLDTLTGIDAVHALVNYYFIAMEGTEIINKCNILGLPIPDPLRQAIDRLGVAKIMEEENTKKS